MANISLTSFTFRPWVWKFQVIQKGYEHLVFKVVRRDGDAPRSELEDIVAKARRVMGSGCRVDFEFLSDSRRILLAGTDTPFQK